jgi:hypothetical protein
VVTPGALLAPAACAWLVGSAAPVVPPPPGPAPAGPDGARPGCLSASADVAGRLRVELPDLGLARAFSLPRAQLALALGWGGAAAARVELAAVRSGGETGYIGVDGESIVPRVQIAEARFGWPATGLLLAAGLVDDPWVALGDAAWGMRAVAATLGEERGWLDRSDLGGTLAWTAPRALATLSVSLTSGEGLRLRERNDGKDLSAVATLRPLALATTGAVLEVSFLVRDGSRGLDQVRDHRLGARAAFHAGAFGAGLELLAATGVGGDAARTPKGLSAWVTLDALGPALAFARVDATTERLGDPAATAFTARAGGGVRLPFHGALAPLALVAAYEATHTGAAAAAVAGAAEATTAHVFWIQLAFRLAGAVELGARPAPAAMVAAPPAPTAPAAPASAPASAPAGPASAPATPEGAS